MNILVVILGLRGSGKTTLLDRARKMAGVKVLQPSTTRERRANSEEYHHLDRLEWERITEQFAWSISIRNYLYGMRHSELMNVRPGEVGVTVFHPGNIADLRDYREQSQFDIVTIGLDTITNFAELQKRIGSDQQRNEGKKSFDEQRRVVLDCDIVLQGDADTVHDAFVATITALSLKGALNKASISSLIMAGTLLIDANTENLQPASYDLRAGCSYWCKGKIVTATEDNPILIPPYSYVIVEAQEKARLPTFIMAHYDIRVSLFVKGIILSNGPQVDPGYSGVLLCMLFNASDSQVGLKLGEHFATIEFYVTNKRCEGYDAQHQKQKSLQEFMETSTVVAPGGTLLDRFNDLQKAWESFRNWFLLAGVSVIIAIYGLVKWGNETMERADKATSQLQSLINDNRNSQGTILRQNVPKSDSSGMASDSITSATQSR